ncbi:hypothetical protein C2E23DRAFT_846192 [Lenzites betulinus]|nr:hypothetical protein C2E23DRAFT_846192 [Lenzites betulinus]
MCTPLPVAKAAHGPQMRAPEDLPPAGPEGTAPYKLPSPIPLLLAFVILVSIAAHRGMRTV